MAPLAAAPALAPARAPRAGSASFAAPHAVPLGASAALSSSSASRRAAQAQHKAAGAPLALAAGIVTGLRVTRRGRRGDRRRHCGAVAARAGSRVLIVGGGIGGLSSAGQLANNGLDVTVFEKNPEVGGRCQSVSKKTPAGEFRWDTGPSLYLLPEKYEQCFERAGAKLEDHVQLKRVDPAYRVVCGDNSMLEVYYDMQKMGDQLEEIEPGAKTCLTRFLSLGRRMLEMGITKFIDRPFSTWEEFLDIPQLLFDMAERGWWTLPFLDIAGPYDSLLSKFFKDPRIRAIFSFQTMYVGLTPYRAPGAFSLLAGTELTDGVWYPVGGFERVKQGLAAVAKAKGVKVRTDCAVDEVIVEGNRAVGVRVGDEVIRGDVVLVNADLPWAYQNLLPNADKDLEGSPVANFGEYWSERKKFSAGVISFYWAFDTKIPKLQQHTVFLACPNNERAAWESVCSPEDLVPEPNFYVHTPSITDPTSAPPGGESVMVLFPVANMQEMANAGHDISQPGVYDRLKEACRATIFRRFSEAGLGDLEKHLVAEEIRDPQEWKQKYNLDHGSAFGLSCGLLQLAMTRPPPKDENGVDGLYFVGASTRPGNGVPLVMMGAGITSGQILKDLGVVEHEAAEA